MKQFLYCEIQDGGMTEFIFSDTNDLYKLAGWLTESCRESDLALIEWIESAEVGQYTSHRLGSIVRLRNLIRLGDWQQRLIEEYDQLKGCLDKLEAFLRSEKWDELDVVDQTLLESQYLFMVGYGNVLEKRIERFEGGQKDA